MSQLATTMQAVDPINEHTLTGAALQAHLMGKLRGSTQRAVMACHAMHREMRGLEEPLSVLSWITIWIRDWGLLEEDAEIILRAMTNPERVKDHNFANELKTSLANAAHAMIKRRESERLAAAARGPDISPEERANAAAVLADYRNRIGSKP